MKMDEKLEKEREERRKLFLSWDIENDLPCEVGDYVLKRIDFPTMKLSLIHISEPTRPY